VPSQLVSSVVAGYGTEAVGSELTASLEVDNLSDEHFEDFWGAQPLDAHFTAS